MGLYMPALEVYWNDSMVSPTTQRLGVIAPTLETGFRRDANFQMLSFVSTQDDEVQFTVQMPHTWKTGTTIYPHVHFTPEANIADGTYNVQFILEYYWISIGSQFPASPSTYTMTKQFTVSSNNHVWVHMMAVGTGADGTGKGISSILQCRLYRDNSVGSNYSDKVAMLGFDIHYEIDGFGSDAQLSKSF